MARRRRLSQRPERRSTRRIRRKNQLGFALIAIVVVAVLGAFYVSQTLDRRSFDPESGCPVDGATELTVVLIDGSDAVAPRQQAFLRNHLEAIKAAVPVGGAIEVYRLSTDTESLLEPVVSICNPGRGSDVDPLTGSRARAERLWEDTFQSRLQDVFDKLLPAGQEDWSPIFESIQSIGITAFASPEWQGKPKRLVLISDLLQYAPDFSHYEGPGDFEAFSQTAYYRRIRTNLSGVEVTVFYLPRPTRNGVQGQAHLDFWKAYFLDQGARPGRPALVVHVEG